MSMKAVIKDDDGLTWKLFYVGGEHDPFPTAEEFQRDLEEIKKNINHWLPPE
jgi:hypothetical protein